VLAKGYDAPLQQVDFAGNAGGATDAINRWVSSNTGDQIPTLLQPGDVTTKTRLVLVDAVYFKGVWDKGFDPNVTAPQPFTLSDGTHVALPTMSALVNLGMGGDPASGLSVYELPYKGGALAMDFFLPTSSLGAFESTLTADALTKSLASITGPSQVQLLLPKFSFTTRLVLNPLLAQLGMPDVFDPTKADLSGMDGARDLYISTVVQQALVEVDEHGTIAAAATSASASNAAGSSVPITVAIDHPFLFLIRDTKNGSILFMGRVEDPRQSS
jgi:serpin B